jgi:hypothetical protein
MNFHVFAFPFQDKLLAGNALDFLGIKREQFQ